jgi:hypothetical protein
MRLENNIINAGNTFFKGSLTLMCMHTATNIIKQIPRAAGKTKKGFHNPKRSKIAKKILMNPTT